MTTEAGPSVLSEQYRSQAPEQRIVTWYRLNRRVLPWRETSDPYAIWVSETMLQQTRVDTVIPYYQRFLSAFPTLLALADANEDEVLKLWQGLGYYSRARNLHQAAKQIATNHCGIIPADEAALMRLPGVGPYTRGALLSIAYGNPVPAVDGNVLRVMARFLALDSPIESKAVQREVYAVVQAWMSQVSPADLSQSLMELGAMVCLPRKPACAVCPLQDDCQAKALSLVDVLPKRRPKSARKLVDVTALWVETNEGLLMERRASEGLLGSLWQLPALEDPRLLGSAPTPEHLHQQAATLYAQLLALDSTRWQKSGTSTRPMQVAEHPLDFALVATERHIFSHIEWFVHVLRPIDVDGPFLTAAGLAGMQSNLRFVPRTELDSLAVPRVYERLMQSILSKKG